VDAYHKGIKSRKQIDELIETARAGNFNALVVQVRRRGDTYYPSEIDPWASDADVGFDSLAYLIEQAHAAGIQVHAWATTLAIWNSNTKPSAPGHAFNRHGPDVPGRDYWLMTSFGGEERAGDQIYYLDPGHPDVVDYTVAVYAELAARYDLDGLHLDRVRYPSDNWGYNPSSLTRFQAQTGRDDLPAPSDAQWLQWRRNQVTALVRKIYLNVTAINPRLRFSAALSTSGAPPTELRPWETRKPYTTHLQDWRGWLEEGILDLALPMAYRDEDSLSAQFDGWLAWAKDHQYSRAAVVGTGLYINSLADSMAQWHLARQPSDLGNRTFGICGYSYATPSDDGASRRSFVNTVVTEVYRQSAPVPGIPWKDTPALGHLMGRLILPASCQVVPDGYPLTLAGPGSAVGYEMLSRTLLTDGSGWFGAVDLPPGDYLLLAEMPASGGTASRPVTVTAGAVAEQELVLSGCSPLSWDLYLSLVLKQVSR
jgi:uncharacterized lipoprotein YddW (UPF0748 family)